MLIIDCINQQPLLHSITVIIIASSQLFNRLYIIIILRQLVRGYPQRFQMRNSLSSVRHAIPHLKIVVKNGL